MKNDITYYDNIIESIKKIKKIDDIPDDIQEVKTKIIEEQKVFFWIRLYINDEDFNIEKGDDIIIKWKPSGEELETKFIAYGKKTMDKDNDGITKYINEDDKKILSLMVNIKDVNFNDSIPFLRTLFKSGYHYDYQLVKREDLIFIHKNTGIIIDYYDCDF